MVALAAYLYERRAAAERDSAALRQQMQEMTAELRLLRTETQRKETTLLLREQELRMMVRQQTQQIQEQQMKQEVLKATLEKEIRDINLRQRHHDPVPSPMLAQRTGQEAHCTPELKPVQQSQSPRELQLEQQLQRQLELSRQMNVQMKHVQEQLQQVVGQQQVEQQRQRRPQQPPQKVPIETKSKKAEQPIPKQPPLSASVLASEKQQSSTVVMRPEGSLHHYFIRCVHRVNSNFENPTLLPVSPKTAPSKSHYQATGGDQANALYLELERMGFAVWYDNRADDLTKEGMRQGIVDSGAVIVFLSTDESDARHGAYDFAAEQQRAPQDLKHLTDAHESLPFRRRGYERDAMLETVIARAGYKDLLQNLQQRKAVSGILRWCESQDEVKVTGNTAQAAAGEHLDWYLNRALAHHMQHALDLPQLPLTDDAEAQRWCSHDEALVRAAALRAVGREQFIRVAQWLADVKGEHFHASTMLFTLAIEGSVFEKKGQILLQSSELLAKAKKAPGWAETKESLQLEFDLNEKMLAALEVGSPAWDEHAERNVEIARHPLFADDPEKKAGSLTVAMFNKMGVTPTNPSPSPQDLREGFQLNREIASTWHQVADLCAEQSGEGGAKEQVYRVNASAWLTLVTPHWPEDYKTIVRQTVRSRQQLFDSIAVLNFERHSPAFKQFGWGADICTLMPVCEEFLELFGDIDCAVKVLEKQWLFIEKYYKTAGRSFETAAALWSGGFARNLGMQHGLWAHFKRLEVTDQDAARLRACYSTIQQSWSMDDGQRTLHSPACYSHMHLYLAGLIAPEGSFDLDTLLSDCPEPDSPLLDDNTFVTCFSFPARLYLGELLERAGMHEQALAQVQPAIAFSQCNPRLKIKAWLLLGRCHVAMGHKHHAHAVIEDAIKEAQRTEQLLSTYQAAAHMMRYVLEPAGEADAIARGGEQLSAARARFTGPEELLEGLGAC
eukprot:g302.t1